MRMHSVALEDPAPPFPASNLEEYLRIYIYVRMDTAIATYKAVKEILSGFEETSHTLSLTKRKAEFAIVLKKKNLDQFIHESLATIPEAELGRIVHLG